MAHTPGPWVARAVPNVGLKCHTGYAIDYNEDQEQVVDFVYEEDDARLIAAAPELLEALQSARDVLKLLGRGSGGTFEQVERAIAAATGAA